MKTWLAVNILDTLAPCYASAEGFTPVPIDPAYVKELKDLELVEEVECKEPIGDGYAMIKRSLKGEELVYDMHSLILCSPDVCNQELKPAAKKPAEKKQCCKKCCKCEKIKAMNKGTIPKDILKKMQFVKDIMNGVGGNTDGFFIFGDPEDEEDCL